MLLLSLSQLTTFSILFLSALTHSLTNQFKQHTDAAFLEPYHPSQPSPDHTKRKPQSQLLSRDIHTVEGYRLSLFNLVQILPINIAAQELRAFWSGVMVTAIMKWQSDDGVLPFRLGNLQVSFESEDPNVPLDWTAILSLATSMRNKISMGGGWAGFFQGTMTNLATQAVIVVTVQYIGHSV